MKPCAEFNRPPTSKGAKTPIFEFFKFSRVTPPFQAKKAKKTFEELIKKFPNSIYSKDAKKKILIANDQLAAKEMNVGRYYQQKNRHLAAIERFKIVINDYNTTAQTPEALYRLTESYLSLGIIEEAKKTTAVLSYNFKESNWYKLSYDLFKKYGYKKNGKQG